MLPWFTGVPEPWEWKGPVITDTGCAYGKFFEKKAAYKDKVLYDLIDGNVPILSKRLKEIGDYGKGGKKGFDTIITACKSSAM